MKQYHIIFILITFLGVSSMNSCSCSSNDNRGSGTLDKQNYNYNYDSYSDGSADQNEPGNSGFYTDADGNNTPAAITPPPTIMDDAEDRYEEGRAQAEEDRLAGHPGMNNEDGNDDYHEGYEDE